MAFKATSEVFVNPRMKENKGWNSSTSGEGKCIW